MAGHSCWQQWPPAAPSSPLALGSPMSCTRMPLNVVQDILPHNANLAIWRRKEVLSSQVQTLWRHADHLTCSESQCTGLQRCNKGHDSVLKVIADFKPFKMTADLPDLPTIFLLWSPPRPLDLHHKEPDTAISLTGRTDCWLWDYIEAQNLQVRHIPLYIVWSWYLRNKT